MFLRWISICFSPFFLRRRQIYKLPEEDGAKESGSLAMTHHSPNPKNKNNEKIKTKILFFFLNIKKTYWTGNMGKKRMNISWKLIHNYSRVIDSLPVQNLFTYNLTSFNFECLIVRMKIYFQLKWWRYPWACLLFTNLANISFLAVILVS